MQSQGELPEETQLCLPPTVFKSSQTRPMRVNEQGPDDSSTSYPLLQAHETP